MNACPDQVAAPVTDSRKQASLLSKVSNSTSKKKHFKRTKSKTRKQSSQSKNVREKPRDENCPKETLKAELRRVIGLSGDVKCGVIWPKVRRYRLSAAVLFQHTVARFYQAPGR